MFHFRHLQVSAVDVWYMRVFVPTSLGSNDTSAVLVTEGKQRKIGEHPQRLHVVLAEVFCDAFQ